MKFKTIMTKEEIEEIAVLKFKQSQPMKIIN